MAAHSSILAWEIPWTKEPGGLQSMVSQSQIADSNESTRNVGGLSSVPRLGRFPGGGMATHSDILDWRIPMDRRA